MNYFVYEVKSNGKVLQNFEQGFSLTRDWEEALDSGNITLKFNRDGNKIPMYSYLEINVYEFNNNDEEVNVIHFEYLVTSDVLELDNKYEYYTNKINLIEYSAKFDSYMMNSLTSSNNVYSEGLAPFKYVLTYYQNPPGTHVDEKKPNTVRGYDEDMAIFFQNLVMPDLKVNNKQIEKSYTDTTLTFKVDEYEGTYQSTNIAIKNWYRDLINVQKESFLAPTYIKVNDVEYIFDTTDTHDITFNVGLQTIEFGVKMPYQEYVDGVTTIEVPEQNVPVFEYYVNIYGDDKNTMFDVVDIIRKGISKYGGIESKLYFERTRLFKLDDNDAEFLKSIPSPQIFLPTATIRQMLTFVLTYVNALPRIINDGSLDTLKLEYYNNIQGTFEINGISELMSEQNTNQIGTRSYSDLKNILPNDLSNGTTYSPSQSGFTNVRSSQIQLTDNTFELPLVKGKPLYKPVKLSFNHSITLSKKNDSGDFVGELINLDFDLTDVWINKSEWDLKEVRDNFPTAYWNTMYTLDGGLASNKTENLYWSKGDTSIKFSEVNGQILKTTLLQSVLLSSINKSLTMYLKALKVPTQFSEFRVDYNINFTNEYWFKDLKFNVEYITDESMVVKQDKEDLSQIDFYSEIRHNQDETIINLTRSSRKIYGDLQRTGNVNKVFSKRHTSLDDMYEIGTIDVNGYVITSITYTFYNFFIDAIYSITKDHNRISQATFIDQTYRWRDNYADQIIDRNEPYNDYVLLIPDEDVNISSDEITKIVDNPNNETIKIMMGILGFNYNTFTNFKTKSSVALVRTDGMLDGSDFKNGDYVNAKMLSVPVSSAGFKQGLIFKFGFQDNQIAGDSIIIKNYQNKDLYFNKPIKYTDANGNFEFLDFHILDTYTYDSVKDINDYPLNDYVINDLRSYFELDNSMTYFSTGMPLSNRMSDDSLIINKDTMSNIFIHYSVNIMSYYNGLFVFGKDFYNDNYLVKEIDENRELFLYIYDNGAKYNLFEDLKVKKGYREKISNNVANIVDMIGQDVIRVSWLKPNDTSYAIGDKEGNLIFASNENIPRIKIMKKHFRPNVKVIGEFRNEYEINLKLSIEKNYVHKKDKEPVDLSIDLFVEGDVNYSHGKKVNKYYDISKDIKVQGTLSYEKQLLIQKSVDISKNINLRVNMIYSMSKNTPPQKGTWQYDGVSSSGFCQVVGFNPLGTECNTIGQTRVVSGEDIGYSGGECHTIICKL